MLEFLPLVIVSGLQVGCLYALMALGYYVIINATGVVNFAQGEWLMVAGVSGVVFISLGLPYFVAMALSIALATGLALLAEAAIIRPLQARGASVDTLVVALIGILTVVRYSTGLLFGREQKPLPPPIEAPPLALGDSLVIAPQTLVVFAVTAAVFAGIWLFLHRTVLGRAFRIAAIDPIGAQVCGVSLTKVRVLAFGLGGFIVAVAGWLYAPDYAAGYLMGEALGIKGFICLIIGGLASMFGALLGGLLLGLFEVAAALYFGSLYSEGMAFGLLMIFLFMRPTGLIPAR